MSVHAITGKLTMDTAGAQLAAFSWPVAANELTLDLSQVQEVDSSAVSVLLHWQRQAKTQQANFLITGVPPALRELVRLYGVEDLLPTGA
ncbi:MULTISPECIES: STAS domain-containing protein [Silvimonas]|uniref:STAS domain-containing protein n=1 Tax=Silvimonas TaxID=300264 RepID=UPI0024B3BBA9|nr:MULTISPECIES: STAS domain-containing protein [Silvimonas]MDR3425893.1 STAS domain-containing protein [Silvimonas sp.]